MERSATFVFFARARATATALKAKIHISFCRFMPAQGAPYPGSYSAGVQVFHTAHGQRVFQTSAPHSVDLRQQCSTNSRASFADASVTGINVEHSCLRVHSLSSPLSIVLSGFGRALSLSLCLIVSWSPLPVGCARKLFPARYAQSKAPPHVHI